MAFVTLKKTDTITLRSNLKLLVVMSLTRRMNSTVFDY